jgi:hypothetical protein
MFKTLALFCSLALTVTFAADEQLTIHKVTIATPSGTISGKVVGTGDKLVFVDDTNPASSFTLTRGEIREYKNDNGAIVVHTARPSTDASGTTSNLRITVVDPANATAITKWLSMPAERARTVTTYSTDVRHDHKGQGGCNGKLLADDTGLRFESVTQADHSRSWSYGEVQSFDKEKDHALLKVRSKSGDSYDFNAVNGATAGALYNLVAQKIVSAR